MLRVAFCIGLALGCTCAGSNDPLTADKLQVSIEPIVDLTPPPDAIGALTLRQLSAQMTEKLAINEPLEAPARCGTAYQVVISPRLLYATRVQTQKSSFIYEWSTLIAIRDEHNALQSHVEQTYYREAEHPLSSISKKHFQAYFAEYLDTINATLKTLAAPMAELPYRFENGTLGEKRMLLERLSICPTEALDMWLGDALSRAEDESIRFRLVGLIGERKVDALGSKLIDLIDLNNMEWTRTIVRTLSVLSHPRALDLFKILSVHESPLLQKELKTAIERLESNSKIP